MEMIVTNALNAKELVDVIFTSCLPALIVGAMEMLAVCMVLHVGLVANFLNVDVRK
jgi:hypothetical protein